MIENDSGPAPDGNEPTPYIVADPFWVGMVSAFGLEGEGSVDEVDWEQSAS